MLVRFFLLGFFALAPPVLLAQREPGSVYHEYLWTTPEDGEAFLRVGGRYGYKTNPGKLPTELQAGDQLIFPHSIDLRGAVRAEVSLEKVLSHEDSRNLRIEINGHAPISIPEPDFLPDPPTEYMYHTDLTVPIPLDQLKDGRPIQFRLSLDTTQRWNWPQNLLYAPENAPRNWVTRSGEFEQIITVSEEVSSALALQLHWVSWSPCYSNGLFLNDHLIWDRNEDCYVFATHSPEFRGHALGFLQTGDNVIRTALTPLFRGKMVHGMEVQWPGVQLKVKYGDINVRRRE